MGKIGVFYISGQAIHASIGWHFPRICNILAGMSVKVENKKEKNSREKILVYGVTGLVGSKIWDLLHNKFKIIAPPHRQLDIFNKRLVSSHLEDVSPDQIIYAAGITKVDEAQSNPKKAFYLNEEIVTFIVKRAAKRKIPFHYLSTDAVFDGIKTRAPYKEGDKTNPISVYGKSKLLGEIATLSASSNNTVIRSEMIYTSYFLSKKDFARVAYESLKKKEQFEGIIDQVITPTFVDDLVKSLSLILQKKAKGIYHVASIDSTTNYGFLLKLANIFNFDKDLISKVHFDEFFAGKVAKRAKYCWLDTSKFQRDFKNHPLKSINKSLHEFKKQMEKVPSFPVDI